MRRLVQNELPFNNLPPGEYQLEIQACLDGGPYGPVTRGPTLVVRPPFWQQSWFVGTAGLCVALLVAGLTTLIQARRNSARLEQVVKTRTAALEESERRYRGMFERNPAVLLVLEPENCRILDANPAACEFFDCSVEELQAKTLSDLTGWPAAELARELGRWRTRASIEWDLPGLRTAGACGALELTASWYVLFGRKVLQISIRDVTVRRQLEEELKEARRIRAVGELAGGIAHDFNNLLTTVLGNAELSLMDGGQSPDERQRLEEICQAGERGADLVQKLLAFGRRQRLSTEVLELNEVVSSMEERLRRVMGAAIQVELKLESSAGPLNADRSQLELVFLQLASNARDAMPEGGTFSIETRAATSADLPLGGRAEDPGTPYLLLAVRDTGCGMSPETRARVFEPFFTTKGAGTSTGLGLSIVHGIVGQSGGLISVSSTPGKGTTILILLPRLAAETLALSAAGSKAGAAIAARDRLPRESSRLHILVVEDEEPVRRAVSALLRGMGHRVIEAEDGESALKKFHARGGAFDLILSDMVMPGIGGRELGRRIRESGSEVRSSSCPGFTRNPPGSRTASSCRSPSCAPTSWPPSTGSSTAPTSEGVSNSCFFPEFSCAPHSNPLTFHAGALPVLATEEISADTPVSNVSGRPQCWGARADCTGNRGVFFGATGNCVHTDSCAGPVQNSSRRFGLLPAASRTAQGVVCRCE